VGIADRVVLVGIHRGGMHPDVGENRVVDTSQEEHHMEPFPESRGREGRHDPIQQEAGDRKEVGIVQKEKRLVVEDPVVVGPVQVLGDLVGSGSRLGELERLG
jgi:hypothetical protein